jgi:hypothetical protein
LYASFTFATLDTNEGEVEGEDFGEELEEDQGQANQGKPSLISDCCQVDVIC